MAAARPSVGNRPTNGPRIARQTRRTRTAIFTVEKALSGAYRDRVGPGTRYRRGGPVALRAATAAPADEHAQYVGGPGAQRGLWGLVEELCRLPEHQRSRRVERMAGHHAISIDYNQIPGCTYCNPQVASIGLTERECKEQGLDYNVGKYNLQAHGKAIAVGATEGLVKVITSKPYGEILGAHIIGEDASELIAEFSVAKRLEATSEDIISTIHAHPTMHEANHEAVLATQGRAIHA